MARICGTRISTTEKVSRACPADRDPVITWRHGEDVNCVPQTSWSVWNKYVYMYILFRIDKAITAILVSEKVTSYA